jgi:hypothetical protein
VRFSFGTALTEYHLVLQSDEQKRFRFDCRGNFSPHSMHATSGCGFLTYADGRTPVASILHLVLQNFWYERYGSNISPHCSHGFIPAYGSKLTSPISLVSRNLMI